MAARDHFSNWTNKDIFLSFSSICDSSTLVLFHPLCYIAVFVYSEGLSLSLFVSFSLSRSKKGNGGKGLSASFFSLVTLLYVQILLFVVYCFLCHLYQNITFFSLRKILVFTPFSSRLKGYSTHIL